jgi:hypothetical protein
VDTVVAHAGRAALLAVSSDAMADLAKAGELFDVDMDQVSETVPLVALGRGAWARDSSIAPDQGG